MIECAIIRDILPLYVDDVLSRESKSLISSHLETCESCRDEFTKMQSEIVKLPSNDGEEIVALKSIKRKLSKQKLIVAIIASMLAVVLASGGYWFVYHREMPVEYTYRITVERAEVLGHAAWLQLLRSHYNYHRVHETNRIINVNGMDTKVVYLYVTETLSTRWPNCRGDNGLNLIGTNETRSFGMIYFDFHSLPFSFEVYYLIAPFSEWDSMSDEDFYEQRHNGVLLWSGTMGQ